MNVADKAKLLLAEFSRFKNIPDLEFDADGGCALVDDKDRVVLLQIDADQERLVAMAPLGALPAAAHCRPEVLHAMLAANLCWGGSCGGTLALEPGSGEAVIQYALPLSGATDSDFSSFIDDFAQLAIYWQERLRGLLAARGQTDNSFAISDEESLEDNLPLADGVLIRG